MPTYKKPDYKDLYPGISDEAETLLKKSDRKMEYQQHDLKRERCSVDTENQKVTFLPSREDSLERLEETGAQFEDTQASIEEIVEDRLMLEKLRQCLDMLSDDERELILALYYDGLTEREYAKTLGISKTALHARKKNVLSKLRKYMET
ncbi:MAG: sigma-70 family RNA polymerase sigma factor [Oscillospiraceae bacterium]|jgi:RNA polymerase sigma factor (sigma-70 family)|nr:sigma-70 family RNA polymerase sigma factor [Oscillospiraceae bacterium]